MPELGSGRAGTGPAAGARAPQGVHTSLGLHHHPLTSVFTPSWPGGQPVPVGPGSNWWSRARGNVVGETRGAAWDLAALGLDLGLLGP